MSINQDAVNLAKQFFIETNRRATPGTMKQNIGQARTLLNAGFSSEEIMTGIKYCTKHPPRNGFQSLGWLSYDLENVLKKVKAECVKEQLELQVIVPENTKRVKKVIEQTSSEDRVNKDFDFTMFDD